MVEARTLRVLFLSSIYSTPRAPFRGPPNARIVAALRRLAEVRVISPVPYYPPALVRRTAVAELAALPAEEPDADGSTVLHPRTLHVPKIGRSAYAALQVASLLPIVRREVRAFRPDAILTAFAYPDGAAAVALGALLDVPVAVRCMGSDIHEVALHGLRRAQIRAALARAGRVIAVSEAMAAAIRELGVPPEGIVVIPNGVDVETFRPVEREEARRALGLPPGVVLLAPGRLSPEKGVDRLLRAAARLEGRPTIVLVGDGPERRALEALTAELGLAGRVRFEGFQPAAQLRLHYSAADLVCLASAHEGWPNVLMEGLACGAPFVATDVGAVSTIRDRTGGGLVVPPGDVAALADGLRRGLAHAWDRAALARGMEEHGMGRVAERYLAALRDAGAPRRA